MPLILGTNSIKDTGYNVANSIRLGENGHYLVRDKTTATNVADLTISVWVKRSTLADKSCIISSWGGDTNNTGSIFFTDGDKLTFEAQTGGSYSANGGVRKITTQVFRDVSAWSHLIFQKDDGVYKIYHNGTEITAFDTNTQSSGTNVFSNASGNTTVGLENLASGGHPFQGYIAEAVLIDGQALAPDQFGEFDDSGIWKPIDVSGLTFGNNGFYLDFEDASNLGNDASGGTDFTENNVATIDQSTDTCTNNFATMNPLANYPQATTFSEGNLKLEWNTNNKINLATIGVSSGKWYWELKYVDDNGGQNLMTGVGIAGVENSGYVGQSTNGWSYYASGGRKYHNATDGTYGDAYTTGDIVGVAFNSDTRTIWFSKNGTWQNSATISEIGAGTTTNSAYTGIGTAGDTFFPVTSGYDGNIVSYNYGSPPFTISSGNSDGNGMGNFEYSVPSGYFALCTSNLAEHG